MNEASIREALERLYEDALELSNLRAAVYLLDHEIQVNALELTVASSARCRRRRATARPRPRLHASGLGSRKPRPRDGRESFGPARRARLA